MHMYKISVNFYSMRISNTIYMYVHKLINTLSYTQVINRHAQTNMHAQVIYCVPYSGKKNWR